MKYKNSILAIIVCLNFSLTMNSYSESFTSLTTSTQLFITRLFAASLWENKTKITAAIVITPIIIGLGFLTTEKGAEWLANLITKPTRQERDFENTLKKTGQMREISPKEYPDFLEEYKKRIKN